MNRISKSPLLAATVLLCTIHPLPAPILEPSSPTPATKQSAKPKVKYSKPKTNGEASPTKTKSEPQSSVSFAGNWTGKATGRIQQAIFGPTEFSSSYKLQISSDERTASWTSSAWLFAKFQAPVQKKGRILTWTCQRHDLAGQTAIFCRLEMDANGTARYSESSGLVNGIFKGAGYELSGTLVRQ